jgi:hypothetical protein
MKYQFGTMEGTADGKVFRKIAGGSYDCDAQAELHAKMVLGDGSGDFDMTDIYGNRITSILIRRGDVEWSVR